MKSTSLSNKPGASIWELTQALALNAPPTANEVTNLMELHGAKLPADYLEFISKHDGATGEIGGKYLSIYTIADVLGVAEASANVLNSQFLLVAVTGYFHYGVRAGAFYKLDAIDDDYQVAMGVGFTEFLRKFEARI